MGHFKRKKKNDQNEVGRRETSQIGWGVEKAALSKVGAKGSSLGPESETTKIGGGGKEYKTPSPMPTTRSKLLHRPEGGKSKLREFFENA